MKCFVSDKGYVFIVPMKSAIEFPNALQMFSKEVGVPIYFIADPLPRQKYKQVRQFCHKIEIKLRLLEDSMQ